MPIRSFEDFREAVFAYRLPRIILTALDLDLFTVVGSRSWTIAELSKEVCASPRGIDILCRNLAAAGLLRKRNGVYQNGRLAAATLNANSPHYRGAYLQLLREQWNDWSQLTACVKRGKPVARQDPDDPAYRRRFTWAMHHRSTAIAPKVAAQVNIRDARTLLDLGGGPGTYALAFLARNPRLHATVCDRAPALGVARKIAASHRAGDRLSYLPLDFMREPVPGRYDVIWYSNVLHIYSPEENQALFRRLLPALAPGGRLLVQDAFLLDREGIYPVEASLFAVTMLLFTERGNTYSIAETSRWLREAGYVRVRRVRMKKGAEDWEGGLLEASRPAARRKTSAPRAIKRKFNRPVDSLRTRTEARVSGLIASVAGD